MVGDAIEQGSRETFVTQHLNPIGELEVGCKDQRQAFINLRAESEERVSAPRAALPRGAQGYTIKHLL